MVGCDGGSSKVRDALDIPLEGLGTIATSVNVFFRSPGLASMHDKGWARFYRMVDETGCWSELIAIDGKEYWRLTVFHDDDPDIAGDSYLKRMMGKDFEFEIIDTSPWERRDYVARTYGSEIGPGRVLIAGDSAHQCSPTGGLGMNTGVSEAYNLAWKFEAVFKGWGGTNLIPSYEIECRPIARHFVDLSTDTYDALSALPAAGNLSAAVEADQSLMRSLSIPDQIRAYMRYEEFAHLRRRWHIAAPGPGSTQAVGTAWHKGAALLDRRGKIHPRSVWRRVRAVAAGRGRYRCCVAGSCRHRPQGTVKDSRPR